MLSIAGIEGMGWPSLAAAKNASTSGSVFSSWLRTDCRAAGRGSTANSAFWTAGLAT